MSSQAFKPRNYTDWLSELMCVNKTDDILKVANTIAQMNPKQAQNDVILVLCEKYRIDLKRAADNAIVKRDLEKKYTEIARALFKCSIDSLLKHCQKLEPNFDLSQTYANKGKTPPGYIKASKTITDDGEVKIPLGFVKKPDPRTDKEGRSNPSLGFLSSD